MKLIEYLDLECVIVVVKELLIKEIFFVGFLRDVYFKGLWDKISGEV